MSDISKKRKGEAVKNICIIILKYLSEKHTCVVREFAMKTFVANRYEVMDRACETQGIEVQKDGNT